MLKYKEKSKNVKMTICMIIIFVINILTEVTHFYEAKYIAVIFYGFFAKNEWGKKNIPENELKSVWKVCMPFLFGSIGAAVDLDLIEPSIVWISFVVVVLGEFMRWFAVVIITW